MAEANGPDYLDSLLERGLLLGTGQDGIYGRGADFEDVVERLDALIVRRWRTKDGAEPVRFPPMMPRRDIEASGYLHSFPQLAGTVHSFCGDMGEHREMLRCIAVGEDWTTNQKSVDLALTPAACYPVYPVIARRGPVPERGWLIDIASYCFRHEPSRDPARMQAFRMHEHVRIGTPEQILAFRTMWLERGREFAAELALPATVDLANDPFFGRSGEVLAANQRRQELKFELLIPILSAERPTACMSFNYHVDHFGQVWQMRTPDGAIAHSGCIGFGLERLTLALFRHHGLDVASWPEPVRRVLWDAA